MSYTVRKASWLLLVHTSHANGRVRERMRVSGVPDRQQTHVLPRHVPARPLLTTSSPPQQLTTFCPRPTAGYCPVSILYCLYCTVYLVLSILSCIYLVLSILYCLICTVYIARPTHPKTSLTHHSETQPQQTPPSDHQHPHSLRTSQSRSTAAGA